jgi:hypothetical protein
MPVVATNVCGAVQRSTSLAKGKGGGQKGIGRVCATSHQSDEAQQGLLGGWRSHLLTHHLACVGVEAHSVIEWRLALQAATEEEQVVSGPEGQGTGCTAGGRLLGGTTHFCR